MFYLLLLLFTLFSIHVSPQDTQQLQIQQCRLIRYIQTGQFYDCQQQGQCLDDPPPSSTQICSNYQFSPIPELNCRKQCCPSLPQQDRNKNLTADDIQQCLSDWRNKQISYVLVILGAVFGIVAILMIIGCTLYYGFIRNPYTNKLVWVGCCCCIKKIDFSKDRGQTLSDQRLGRNMVKQKKIDLNKVIQYETNSNS